jgi:hypothetical protein
MAQEVVLKIIMEQRKRNVDGWLEEKMVNSLTEVAGAARWAKELENLKIHLRLPYEERYKYELVLEGVISELYAALYDLTKIASILNDKDKWSPDDRDQIYSNDREGLADVLVKYGLSGWLGYLGLTDVNPQEKINVQDVLRQIRELAKGAVGGNRTLIYVELRKIAREPPARQILDLIEPVTQGEKNWTTFQREIDELLKDI